MLYMKTTKPELEVPAAATDALHSVVAELRKLFSEIVTDWDAGDLSSAMDGFRMIRDRADELEAGA